MLTEQQTSYLSCSTAEIFWEMEEKNDPQNEIFELLLAVSIMGRCVSLPPQNKDMQNTWADQGWANDVRH